MNLAAQRETNEGNGYDRCRKLFLSLHNFLANGREMLGFSCTRCVTFQRRKIPRISFSAVVAQQQQRIPIDSSFASWLETNPVRSRALIQTNNDLHSSSSSSSSRFEEAKNSFLNFVLLSLFFTREAARTYRSTSLIVSPTVIRQKRVVPLAPHLDTARAAQERDTSRPPPPWWTPF